MPASAKPRMRDMSFLTMTLLLRDVATERGRPALHRGQSGDRKHARFTPRANRAGPGRGTARSDLWTSDGPVDDALDSGARQLRWALRRPPRSPRGHRAEPRKCPTIASPGSH